MQIIRDPNLKDMVTDRILDWYTANKRFPKNILYYRDGVSNSQYPAVKKFELPAIGAAFNVAAHKANVSPTPRFNLTAIIVAKRHHVRFFPLQGGADNTTNCKPGTIVDSMVTDPCYTDFYLQSHRGLKGTAKPAHYFVLQNEMGLSEVQIQDFVSAVPRPRVIFKNESTDMIIQTHKLSYTYVRATMGVSYAPPAYYADHLCERGRCYLRKLLNPDGEQRQTVDNMKSRLERERREARDKKYSPRGKDAKGRVIITDAERKHRKKHADEVDLELRRYTFGEAQKIFRLGGGDGRGNPWKENIGETMFWM